MKERDKKICCVIPTLKAGGMERVMSELANEFATHLQYEIHLIVLVKSEPFYKLSDYINYHEPHFLFDRKHRFLHQIKTFFFLRKKLRNINPRVVLSFGETYNSFVLLCAIGLGLKIFISDRSEPDRTWGNVHESLRKTLYSRAHGIICQTAYSKKVLYRKIFHKNIAVIPNPVRLSKFAGIVNKENIILTVGRLISTKRIDLLINIFKEANDGNYQLWVVGDGPQRPDLERLVERCGLSGRVKFWGSQKNIEEFYQKAKVFAFTSMSEGFPNVLLEAVASGLPVISFNCTGVSDLVHDGVNGYLIPEGNTNLYVEKMETMMWDTEKQQTFGISSKRVAAPYDISVIGKRYLNFLFS